jgi:PAS domain S-box-containing protein
MLETMTGYRQDEVPATGVRGLLHGDRQEAFKGHAFARQQGHAVPAFDELELVTKGGEQRWVHAGTSPIECDGEFPRLGAAIDITEQQQPAVVEAQVRTLRHSSSCEKERCLCDM